MNVVRGRFPSTDRDPARSYEPLDEADLERLGRAANAELKAFFNRNPHLVGWRDRLRVIALCQGGAEHYLRGRRGVWDLDVIVCFADDPKLRRPWRRMVVSWDWGPSKLGRCSTTHPSTAAARSTSLSRSPPIGPTRWRRCARGSTAAPRTSPTRIPPGGNHP